MVIADEPNALHALSFISYFWLASFFRPLEADKHTHQFRQGCTLEQVMALYEFDTALREIENR
ncbi:MAG: Abi family protein [Prevotella sp.]|nr:Abi family protein [Prevotella sp.]